MADGIPTARGKTRWFPATIRAVMTSDNAAVLAQASSGVESDVTRCGDGAARDHSSVSSLGTAMLLPNAF
jgi:hypothetical protein